MSKIIDTFMTLVTYYLFIAIQKDWTGLHSYHLREGAHTQQIYEEDATINLLFIDEKPRATEVK